MPPIWDLIAEREITATEAVQGLREQIAKLTDELAVAETELAEFGSTTGGMRAKDVCLALGIGTTPRDTEGIRAKLKRLAVRQILVETEPGLFALAPATPSA